MEQKIIDAEAEAILTDDAKQLVLVEGRHIAERIVSLKVSNEAEYRAACELGVRNKEVLNRLEAFRKAIVKPMQDAVKNTNGIFERLASRFAENQEKINRAVTTYFTSRKKTEAIKTTHISGGGRTSMQRRWTFDILNDDLVPREFCKPDEMKIRRHMNAGTREIPGVRIYEKETPVFVTD